MALLGRRGQSLGPPCFRLGEESWLFFRTCWCVVLLTPRNHGGLVFGVACSSLCLLQRSLCRVRRSFALGGTSGYKAGGTGRFPVPGLCGPSPSTPWWTESETVPSRRDLCSRRSPRSQDRVTRESFALTSFVGCPGGYGRLTRPRWSGLRTRG